MNKSELIQRLADKAETRKRAACTGFNARTGKEIKIGPSTSASFKVGKRLNDSLS